MRRIRTTLLQAGGKCGTLLINYATEDTTANLSRERCGCGRIHMRIYTPERDAETVRVHGNAFNRVDVEAAVFPPENRIPLTGEYAAFVYDGNRPDSTIIWISVECFDQETRARRGIEDRFTERFLKNKPGLSDMYQKQLLDIVPNFTGPDGLELFRLKGRPKRLVDQRST